jgi:hypothetical protein
MFQWRRSAQVENTKSGEESEERRVCILFGLGVGQLLLLGLIYVGFGKAHWCLFSSPSPFDG